MDVVALAQLGFPNAVATLGTACTSEHVHKLFRFTDNVVFSFDGDAAGRRAARKALDGAIPYASDVRSVKFLFLPAEHDPDSFIRAFGKDAFAHCVSEAMPLSRFMIGCDKCERWYHGPCVGVGKQAADSLDDYLCPLCTQAAGVPYAFGPPLPLPRLTRRPKLKYVATLLAEADEIGVETPEAELIRAIVARATEWQARANALLAAR
jgi:DNA primase